jgi:hypothetical protein
MEEKIKCYIFVLCLVYTMLPVSLDCSFFFAPSVFSNMYLGYTGQINVREYRRGKAKGQSRETGSIGYTQDTGQINVREYRRGNAKPFVLPLRYSLTFICPVYPMLPVSMDCPFVLSLRYSLTCICPVSCVPYVASFSGLSFFFT